MPFSVINLRIDERETERRRERKRRNIKYSSLAHEEEGRKKKNLSRVLFRSIFVTSAVCISARFPSSRQPFFPFREYACSSTTVVSISRPELGCKILEALALKYLWTCTHLRLLILRHHPTPFLLLVSLAPRPFFIRFLFLLLSLLLSLSSSFLFCLASVPPPFFFLFLFLFSSARLSRTEKERELIRGPRDSRENVDEAHPLHQSRLISIRYLAMLAWLARFRAWGSFFKLLSMKSNARGEES